MVSYFSMKCQILAPSTHYFVNYYPIKVGTKWQLKVNTCLPVCFKTHMVLIPLYTLNIKTFRTNISSWFWHVLQQTWMWLMLAYHKKPHKSKEALRTEIKKKNNNPEPDIEISSVGFAEGAPIRLAWAAFNGKLRCCSWPISRAGNYTTEISCLWIYSHT